ncbi:MAG TPA: glutamate-cysteine ligase family protein, partial [Longimicrobiaceae bacterium]|nr:glutamate-cysteine ligase family protein [Longimicrobiaceae bacterium]
ARLFDVKTHGWMNVQASHLNLPLGREEEAVALLNAAALLIPYLPALAASSPMYDGELQDAVDNRLAWILQHQARIPESCGDIVPEFVHSLSDYRKNILGPMYQALDHLPDSGVLRHEFFNARGAVIKFSRKAMELRVLDVQECVKMDVAIAVFARAVLRHLAARLRTGRLRLPDHSVLVNDFRSAVWQGSAARVRAPHVGGVERDAEGRADIRDVLRELLSIARKTVRKDEAAYLDLVEPVVERGSLSERIRQHLLPHVDDDEGFTEAARRLYIELADCLDGNEVWRGR